MKHTFTTTPQAYTSEAKFKTGEPINSSLLLPCQKLKLNNLSRRILTGCYNEHPLVRYHDFKKCNLFNFLFFFRNMKLWIVVTEQRISKSVW